MKKILFVALGLMASTSFGAWGTTGTIQLSGTVDAKNEIEVRQDSVQLTNASTLDIENGESATDVADVGERSNNLNGYKILMTSANASKLVLNASHSTTYQLSYDGGAYQSIGTNTQVKDSGALTAYTEDTSKVRVNVAGYLNAPAGVYKDTITVSIVAN